MKKATFLFGMIALLGLFVVSAAQAAPICESDPKLLNSMLQHPLFLLQAQDKSWDKYRPLLKGGIFAASPKGIAFKYGDKLIEGKQVCVEMKTAPGGKNRIYVRQHQEDLTGTDAVTLLPERPLPTAVLPTAQPPVAKPTARPQFPLAANDVAR